MESSKSWSKNSHSAQKLQKDHIVLERMTFQSVYFIVRLSCRWELLNQQVYRLLRRFSACEHGPAQVLHGLGARVVTECAPY